MLQLTVTMLQLTVTSECDWLLEELCSDNDLDRHICGRNVCQLPTHHNTSVSLVTIMLVLAHQSAMCVTQRMSAVNIMLRLEIDITSSKLK